VVAGVELVVAGVDVAAAVVLAPGALALLELLLLLPQPASSDAAIGMTMAILALLTWHPPRRVQV
jgi:hypothetical protein